MLLTVLLILNACSLFRTPEKEIITVPTVVETPEIEVPIIQIVPRPNPVEMKNADIVVVTESNLQEVVGRIKNTHGELVLYAMTADSFESLALNLEQIKRFIDQQSNIILYYEKNLFENNSEEP